MDANICYSIGFVAVFFLLHWIDRNIQSLRNAVDDLEEKLKNRENI